jgi:hypothetical protein
MLKLLNNSELMQKFTVDAMQKLNEHYECRNIVYKLASRYRARAGVSFCDIALRISIRRVLL